MERDGTTETWSAEPTTRADLGDGLLHERLIRVSAGSDQQRHRVLRVEARPGAAAAALILLRPTEGRWEVVLPGESHPRIYPQYPLRGSSFVPTNFVLDGRFEPDQERSRVLMTGPDREALAEAFDAAVLGAAYACRQEWGGAHLLARAACPASGFDLDDVQERTWWRDALASFAERLAHLSIVDTTKGPLPAFAAEGASADFIMPRMVDASSADETTTDRMWPLVDEATGLDPPVRDLSGDWSEMADGWTTLGLQPNRVTVASLGRTVRQDASEVNELAVRGDPVEWLSRYTDVVGECWERRSGLDASVLQGLLPNQRGVLSSPHELRIDAGVPDQLKDICELVDLDIRGDLLSTTLVQSNPTPVIALR